MSDLSIDTFPATRRASERPRIPLANGDFLEPRRQWAGGVGVSDKTASRMNLPTAYIGNVAYVLHNASTEDPGHARASASAGAAAAPSTAVMAKCHGPSCEREPRSRRGPLQECAV